MILQCKLLAEPDLMFDKAFKIAKAMEAAEKEAMDLHDTHSTGVHQLGKATVNKKNPEEFQIPCPIRQRQQDATDAEHNTNRQIANSETLNAIIAKRKDTLLNCAAPKSKARIEHR